VALQRAKLVRLLLQDLLLLLSRRRQRSAAAGAPSRRCAPCPLSARLRHSRHSWIRRVLLLQRVWRQPRTTSPPPRLHHLHRRAMAAPATRGARARVVVVARAQARAHTDSRRGSCCRGGGGSGDGPQRGGSVKDTADVGGVGALSAVRERVLRRRARPAQAVATAAAGAPPPDAVGDAAAAASAPTHPPPPPPARGEGAEFLDRVWPAPPPPAPQLRS
jgi:hypothetical protein